MPVPRAMVSACAMPPMMSKFTAGSPHAALGPRRGSQNARGRSNTHGRPFAGFYVRPQAPAVAPRRRRGRRLTRNACHSSDWTGIFTLRRMSRTASTRMGTGEARGMRRERTAGERLGRAVVDERDNRAGRARFRSAPQRSRGHQGNAPSSIERRKEASKALRWSGRSQKTPGGVIQAFHFCGTICGTTFLNYCFY